MCIVSAVTLRLHNVLTLPKLPRTPRFGNVDGNGKVSSKLCSPLDPGQSGTGEGMSPHLIFNGLLEHKKCFNRSWNHRQSKEWTGKWKRKLSANVADAYIRDTA